MRIARSWRCCGRYLGRLKGSTPARIEAVFPLAPSLPTLRSTWLPLNWLLVEPCPLCGRARGHRNGLCQHCLEQLDLPDGGLHGDHPLPWWAAGSYDGALRRRLLGLRKQPRPSALMALLAAMDPVPASAPKRPMLVPIPSWKKNPNPLPALLCRCFARRLGFARAPLLARRHPVLGQHRLGRAARLANQRGSFLCLRPPRQGEARRRPLLLVDDILTSGATAQAAAAALREGGWLVEGLLCLARTPARRDLN
jgi:predicted amidophosphoribosyltransferase